MILHIHKRESPYVQIDKRPLEDERLSWKAKGILAYLLSKPPGWTVRREDIENHGSDGREAVQSGLKDLEAYGYAALISEQGDKGQLIGKKWLVAESPELLSEVLGKSTDERESRLTVKPADGKPVQRESRPYSNNDLSKNEERENEDSKTPLSPPLFPELEPEHPLASHAVEVAKHLQQVREEKDAEAKAIYREYPKKVAPLAAIKAIKKALKSYAFEFLKAKVENYAICRVAKDPQFTWAPATFFNDGHFLDDEAEWTSTGSTKFKQGQQSQFPISGVKPAPKLNMSGEERRRQRAALEAEQAEFQTIT